MIYEGVICGISPFEMEDWTLGELIMQVKAERERQRREYQAMSVIAAGQARYQGAVFSGSKKTLPPLYEIFPFWTEEEVTAAKIKQIRCTMERHAAARR